MDTHFTCLPTLHTERVSRMEMIPATCKKERKEEGKEKMVKWFFVPTSTTGLLN